MRARRLADCWVALEYYLLGNIIVEAAIIILVNMDDLSFVVSDDEEEIGGGLGNHHRQGDDGQPAFPKATSPLRVEVPPTQNDAGVGEIPGTEHEGTESARAASSSRSAASALNQTARQPPPGHPADNNSLVEAAVREQQQRMLEEAYLQQIQGLPRPPMLFNPGAFYGAGNLPPPPPPATLQAGFYPNSPTYGGPAYKSTSIPTHRVAAIAGSPDLSGEQELTAQSRYVNKWSPGVFSQGNLLRNGSTASPSQLMQSASPHANATGRVVENGPSAQETATLLKKEINSMKQDYESKIRSLEQRISAAEERSNSSRGPQTHNLQGSRDGGKPGEGTAMSHVSPGFAVSDTTTTNQTEGQLGTRAASLEKELHSTQQEVFFLEDELRVLRSKVDESNSVQAQLAEEQDEVKKLELLVESLKKDSTGSRPTSINDLETVFRKREEELQDQVKKYSSLAATAQAHERSLEAELNSLRAEREKLIVDVEKWSKSSNAFRVQRDDYESQLKSTKRQMELDAANMAQAEYQNQKTKRQNDVVNQELDKKERALRAAADKIENLSHELYEMRCHKDVLENAMKLKGMVAAGAPASFHHREKSPTPKHNYSPYNRENIQQNSPYGGGIGQRQMAFHNRFQNAPRDDSRLGRRQTQQPVEPPPSPQGRAPEVVARDNRIDSANPISPATRPLLRRKSQWGGPGEFGDAVEESKTTATDRVFQQQAATTTKTPPQAAVVTEPEMRRFENAVPVIDSNSFPMAVNESRTEVQGGYSNKNIQRDSQENSAPRSHEDGDKAAAAISFSEAMARARQKQAARESRAARIDEMPATEIGIKSPEPMRTARGSNSPLYVEAQTFAAKQKRSNFKIEDPQVVKSKFTQNLRDQRTRRSEAAPFATEASMKLQRTLMSDIEDELVRLGLEKTRLETELMRTESIAKRRMDARHRKKLIENRLGEINARSSNLRQELRRVEGR